MTHSDPATPATTAPVRRSLRWLLIGSLTVNFLLLGLGLGAIIGNRHGGPPRAMELTLGPFARALDAGDRRAIARDLMRADGVRPPSRMDRNASMAELVLALRSDPFSVEAVRVVIDRQSDWVQSAQHAAQDAVLARIAAMTPAARLALADRLAQENEDGRDGSDGPGGPGGPDGPLHD